MASSGTYTTRNFNLAAQGHRQPGSAFKTFVLTAAIRKGSIRPRPPTRRSRSTSTTPIRARGGQDLRELVHRDREPVARDASSDNTVYAQLILDIGPKAVCETAKLLGITTKLDCYPAEGLGGLTLGVTPLEMAGAYATLASGGIRHRPTGIEKVVFPDGKSENLANSSASACSPTGEAYEVTKILKMNVQSGTGTAANYGCPAAGQDRDDRRGKDAWFVGYTPELSAAVWVGYPDAGSRDAGRAGRHLRRAGLARLHAPRPRRLLRRLPAAHGAPPSSRRSSASTRAPARRSGPTTRLRTTAPDTSQQYDPRFYEQAPLDAPGPAAGRGGRARRPATGTAATERERQAGRGPTTPARGAPPARPPTARVGAVGELELIVARSRRRSPTGAAGWCAGPATTPR